MKIKDFLMIKKLVNSCKFMKIGKIFYFTCKRAQTLYLCTALRLMAIVRKGDIIDFCGFETFSNFFNFKRFCFHSLPT